MPERLFEQVLALRRVISSLQLAPQLRSGRLGFKQLRELLQR
jgi:hypothetical protein